MGIDIVTGSNGFLGSALVRALEARGRDVHGIDLERGYDIRLQNGLFPGGEIDTIYHLAALADIVPSIENPRDYYDTNVTGTLNVLEMARKYGCRRFVYAASASCYGMCEPLWNLGEYEYRAPTSEKTKCDPEYPYALTKHLGEQLIMHWHKVYGIPAVSLRLFNAYGPGMKATNAYGGMFKVFLPQLANSKPLTVVGDGTQKRDFVHVSDVVDAFLLAAERGKPGEAYNIGSGVPTSVNEIVRLLGAPAVEHLPKRPGEPDITWADISKAKNDLGWEPKVGIDEGVAEMLGELDRWKDAPVWTKEQVNVATKEWFEKLREKVST